MSYKPYFYLTINNDITILTNIYMDLFELTKYLIYILTLISGHMITWRSCSGWRTDILLRSSGWLSKFASIDTASVRGELSSLSILFRTVLQACMRSNISREEPGNWRDKNLGPRYLKQVLRTNLDELFKAERKIIYFDTFSKMILYLMYDHIKNDYNYFIISLTWN